jgi:hypothetical protein
LKTALIILLFFLTLPLCAQRILILEKLGSGKIYTYKTGDPITLQRTADNERFTATITFISDSGIIVDMKQWIRIGDIHALWRKFPHRKRNGNYFIVGGAALVGIVTINNLANNNTVVDPLFLAIGAGISAVGVLWRLSSVQKYTVGNRWKLKILDAEFL